MHDACSARLSWPAFDHAAFALPCEVHAEWIGVLMVYVILFVICCTR